MVGIVKKLKGLVMIWKAICRDIFSRQRSYLFFFSLVLVLLIKGSLTHRNDNMTITLFSVLLVSMISSCQLFFSYFKTNRVQGYYQLPISTTKFYLQFLLVAFVSNLVERLLLLIILFGEANWKNILLVVLYSLLIIVSVFRLIKYWVNSHKNKFKIPVAIYIFLLLLTIPIVKSTILLLPLLIIELILVLKDNSYFYLDDISSKNDKLNFKNYFLTALLKERYFYLNTAVSILFMLILSFQDLPQNLKFPMLFTVAATNTPLTTLISSSPQLNLHLHSLPKSSTLYNMYLRCLLYYFCIMNGMVAIFYVYITHSWIHLVMVGFYTLFEAITYLFLEKHFSIENWKVKKELWKHPRKYIVPILTYLVFFILM